MYGVREVKHNFVEIYDLPTQYIHAYCHINDIDRMLRYLTAFNNLYK